MKSSTYKYNFIWERQDTCYLYCIKSTLKSIFFLYVNTSQLILVSPAIDTVPNIITIRLLPHSLKRPALLVRIIPVLTWLNYLKITDIDSLVTHPNEWLFLQRILQSGTSSTHHYVLLSTIQRITYLLGFYCWRSFNGRCSCCKTVYRFLFHRSVVNIIVQPIWRSVFIWFSVLIKKTILDHGLLHSCLQMRAAVKIGKQETNRNGNTDEGWSLQKKWQKKEHECVKQGIYVLIKL